MMTLVERLQLLRELEATAHRLVELGVLEAPGIADGSGGAVGARTEGVSADGPMTRGEAPSRGGAGALAAGNGEGAQPREKRRCLRCGRLFQVRPHGTKRVYCTDLCRTRAAWQRRQERENAREAEAALTRARTVIEHAEREGVPVNLWKGNGHAAT